MSLNNIILPGIVVADLYKKSLVDIPGDMAKIVVAQDPVKEVIKKEQPPTPPFALQYLGKNLKKVAIVVHYPEQVYLPEEQLNFLTAVLKACQLNMGDIAIVNNAKQVIDFPLLMKELEMRQLILFGNMQEVVDGTEPFVIKTVDGVSVLASPALEALNAATPAGKVLKSNLWGCLKQLFNV